MVAFTVGILNSGCFVVTSNHVSKPIGPHGTVELHHDKNSGDEWYVRHFHTPDLDFDVGLENSTERSQIGFLLWVLPIPYPQDYVLESFRVRTDFRPTGRPIVIDPWRIEYVPTNGVSVTPSRIFQVEESSSETVAISVQKPESSFILEYQAPCNPDSPVKLSINGVPVSNVTDNAITVTYERATLTRAGFRLPY